MICGTLALHRFNGIERFEIKTAKMFLLGDPGNYTLWFELETTNEASVRNEDTAAHPATPSLSVGVRITEFSVDTLVGSELRHAGIPCEAPEEDEDVSGVDEQDVGDALMYYYEHQPLRDVRIAITRRSEDGFFVRWTATTPDVNLYDGSVPDTKVEIEAVFSWCDG